MKKTLLLLASAALLLVGCAKEQGVKQAENRTDDEMVTATFAVSMENGVATKAVADGDGMGKNANRCIMVLYYGDKEYGRYTAAVSNYKATFNAKLPAKRTYKAVFWADFATDNGDGTFTDVYYATGDLTNITLKSDYVGNDDKRDAFFKCEEYTVKNKSQSFTATLTRPFAQINVISNDIKDIHLVELYPKKVNLSFSAPTSFNAMSGECGTASEIEYEADVYKAYDSAKTQLTLSMDYLFAGDRSTVDIDFKAPTEGTFKVEHSFTSVPYERNYRTNILGNLLTAEAQWEVTIDKNWKGSEDVPYVEAGSVAAANQALADGKTSININNPSDTSTPVSLPSATNGKEVSINATGVSGNMTFEIAEGAEGPSKLNISTDIENMNLTVTCPNTHVEVDKGAYNTLTATTSATTLVVGKDVTVETLTVSQGNIEIHGKVATLNRSEGISAEMYASDRATLISYINWAKSGDVAGLETDIDLAGENWTPAHFGDNNFTATFDGCGHTIKNMTVVHIYPNDKGQYYGGGFFYSMNGTMKNVTFENASVNGPEAGKGNVFGIAAGYAYGNVTFENIKVKDSEVSAFGKVGGILGMAANPGSTVTTMKNCSLENVEITGTYNVANYIGLLQNNVSLTGCSSTKVTKKLSVRYGENAYVTFDKVKVIDNSDPDNPKYVLSSGKYWLNEGYYYSAFAEYYNDAKYDGWKAENYGEVDGIVFNDLETPDPIDLEPVAMIGSKNYYDLPSALSALQEGQTLEIVQAGEYTVQTLSTPANTTIDAKVDGVVFNRTAGGWVANQIDGRTVKNITWNVGNSNYQYFHGVDLVNCKVNGILCTHSNNTYTDCEFYNAEGYNFWEYGTGSTFTRCKFTCPGKNEGVTGAGGCVNAYNEGEQGLKKVVFDNCEFIALNPTNKYAAVYIKNNSSFDVEFKNCTANDNFCTGAISGSKLWNVNNNNNLNHKVTVDDQLVYANGTVLAISTPAQLKNFADAVNAGKSFKGLTAFLANDIDLAGETVTPIGAGDKKFDGTFDGKEKTISNIEINGSSNGTALFGHVWEATIKNLKITNAKVTNTALDYTGILAGNGYANISGCDINGTVEGQEQVGAVIGYLSCGSIMNCKVDATVKGTSRVGVLCAKANVDSQYKIEGNTIKGSATSNDIYAGGVVGQIMCGTGKVWTIKNNSIDATVSTGGSLIGNVRSGNWDAFVAGYQTNVTGNTWTAAGNCKITDGNPEHSVEISK